MAVELDPSAERLMALASALLRERDVVKRQRSIIWGLMTALRSERTTNAELLSLLDSMLSNEFDG